MSPRRQAAVLTLTGYTLVLGAVLLSPSSAPGTASVDIVSRALATAGIPPALADPTRVEVALNVAIFVPWTAMASVVWPRVPWQTWTAYGFIATGAVETAQAVVLGDGRSATFSDVVANTLGALLGSLAVTLLRGRGGRGAG